MIHGYSRLEIEPMIPTEDDLDDLAAYTQEWAFDDVLRYIPMCYHRTMFRRTIQSWQWQEFARDTIRIYGDVGTEVILERLGEVCEEHIRQQRELRAWRDTVRFKHLRARKRADDHAIRRRRQLGASESRA